MIGIIYLAVMVLMLAGMWKTYEKLGLPGWACIIPIYNIIVLMQKFNWEIWKIVMFIIPVVNIIFSFLLWQEVANKFGKGVGFVIGMLLLPFVFFPLLGFKEEVVSE